MLFLESTPESGNIDVASIAQGRSPRFHGFAEDGDDGVEEPARRSCVEGGSDAERMETSSVQDLIRIDVADPCDQMLIEEHCLHRPPRSSNDSPHIVERKVVHDGIDPETVEFGQDRWTSIRIECDDLAEGSRVDES